MALIVTDTLGNTYSLVINPADGSLVTTPVPGVTPTPGGANSITVPAISLITAAMQEIGVLAAGESPSNNDAAWVLQKLQRLIDRYNARMPMVYNVNFSTFQLQANHQPHTIGPGADFDVIQRPQSIESISLILPSTGGIDVDIPMNKRDEQWWANERVKNITSTFPTDFYYSPDWFNGSIYFWPIPTSAYRVRIETRVIIQQATAYTQNYTMPPGYWDLTVWDLACDIAPSFEKPVTADMLRSRAAALKAVQVNNIASPRGKTGDAGMPGVGLHGGFNYYDGLPN